MKKLIVKLIKLDNASLFFFRIRNYYLYGGELCYET